MDEEILLWLNRWVGHFTPVDAVAKALVSDYLVPVLMSLTLLGLWFWGRGAQERKRLQYAVITGMIAMGIANLAVSLINDAYFRPRPFTQYELTLLFYRPTDSSFPANPVAVAFAVSTGVFMGHRLMGIILAIVGAFYGLARIYAGVFYPSDVAAGAAIGVVCALVVFAALWPLRPVVERVLKVVRALYLA